MAHHEIPVGIGVHSGVAFFGAVGTPDGLTDITAVGDEVNVAARLASQSRGGRNHRQRTEPCKQPVWMAASWRRAAWS